MSMLAVWPQKVYAHNSIVCSVVNAGQHYINQRASGRRLKRDCSRQLGSLLPFWVYTRIYIWLVFAHADGVQYSCASNLVREQFRESVKQAGAEQCQAQTKLCLLAS